MTIQCSIRRRVGGLGPIVLAFVLATTGCAARVASSATDIRPVLKATRVAIATAHARLDSAIARSDTAAVIGLFDDSATVYTREARVAARGRNGALAFSRLAARVMTRNDAVRGAYERSG